MLSRFIGEDVPGHEANVAVCSCHCEIPWLVVQFENALNV